MNNRFGKVIGILLCSFTIDNLHFSILNVLPKEVPSAVVMPCTEWWCRLPDKCCEVMSNVRENTKVLFFYLDGCRENQKYVKKSTNITSTVLK